MQIPTDVKYNAVSHLAEVTIPETQNSEGNCGWRKIAVITGVICGAALCSFIGYLCLNSNQEQKEDFDNVCGLVSRCISPIADCINHGIRTVLDSGLDEYCGFSSNGTLEHSAGEKGCCLITNLTNFVTKREKRIVTSYGHNGEWKIGENVGSIHVSGYVPGQNLYNVSVPETGTTASILGYNLTKINP